MPPFTSVTGEGLGEHSLVKPLVSLPLENIQPVNEDLSGALCVQDTELRVWWGMVSGVPWQEEKGVASPSGSPPGTQQDHLHAEGVSDTRPSWQGPIDT